MTVAISLEEARARLSRIGRTAADVARELGVSKATVQGVLDGKFKGTRGDAHKGGGKQVEIDAQAWQIIKTDYLRAERPSFAACYHRLVEDYEGQ